VKKMWTKGIQKARFCQYPETGPKLISDLSPTVKTRKLYFNRTQSSVVIGLFIGHNTMRRYLYLMELIRSHLCVKCEAEDETSAHVLCECEALASLRRIHLGSFS